MAERETLVINMDDLTKAPFKDQIVYEDFTGQPFSGIANVGASPSARVMVGLVWLARHRVDPSFTIDQALEYDYTTVDFADDESNPTEAAEPTPLAPLRSDKPARRKASATA